MDIIRLDLDKRESQRGFGLGGRWQRSHVNSGCKLLVREKIIATRSPNRGSIARFLLSWNDDIPPFCNLSVIMTLRLSNAAESKS